MSNEYNPYIELVETNAFFAFVVDGEVAHMQLVENELEGPIAAFSSDPKVVLLKKEDAPNVRIGWTYDGETFTPPAGE